MGTHIKITRREALRRGITAVAGVCANHALPGLARGNAKTGQRRANPAVQPPLAQFGYAAVQLGPSPLRTQFEENHRLLLNLNEDSLLRPFRIREGLPAPGQDLGGWYDTYAFAPGCTYGQWLSALARFYAATRDELTHAKIGRLVRGYAATIDPAGKFYLENRFPAYTYDKLVCGLLDAHTLADDEDALGILARATDAVWTHLPAKAMPHQETPLVAHEDFTEHVWDESYTLPENLFLAWQQTGTTRYGELAERFLFNKEFFDPLARGENALPGKHAYSHVNALSSAAAAYLALGDEKYLRAAKNGFAMVQQQSYATGGWGPDEHFVVPGSGKLFDSLTSTHATFETPCGAYAHFKITRYLLRITKDSRYGDSMERVLYNTVLGAKPLLEGGSAFYYSDYNFQGTKTFFRDKWPCCSGTLPLIAADYRISAYFRDASGVYVNLYVPSTVTWKRGAAHCSLRQTTDYPYDSSIRINLTISAPVTFSVFLRVPEWAKGANVTVNGMRDSRNLVPGTFAEIRREWKNEDRIELDLPLTSRLEAIDQQHPDTVALVSGPLALMALGTVVTTRITRGALLSARQGAMKSHAWTAETAPGELRLKPFVDIADEAYTTYLNVQSG